MDVIGTAFLICIGLTMLVIGARAGVRDIALNGVANILAGYLLFPGSGFGWLHYLALTALAVLLGVAFKSFDRRIWRSAMNELTSPLR